MVRVDIHDRVIVLLKVFDFSDIIKFIHIYLFIFISPLVRTPVASRLRSINNRIPRQNNNKTIPSNLMSAISFASPLAIFTTTLAT